MTLRVRSRTLPLACVLLFVLPASAQKFAFSPSNAATKDGSGSNTIPFGALNIGRYQQIHGDLSKPMLLTRLSFRRDAALSTRSMTARTVDVEVVLAQADFKSSGLTFASNYKGKATVAIKRKRINLPDISLQPGGPTAPWNVHFALDAVWVFVPTADLLWEMRIHNAPLSGAYFVDFHSYFQFGASKSVGTSCIATGQSRAMLLQQFIRTIGWNKSLQFMWRFFRGAKSAPAVILLGPTQNPVSLPGLCTRIYLPNPAAVFGGTSSSSGSFSVPGSPSFWKEAPWSRPSDRTRPSAAC